MVNIMEELKVIKIFEDRQRKLFLTQQEENDILSMKRIIGENNINLQADGNLLIRHYVGFVQVNKTRLLVYPKIAIKSTKESDYDKAFEILIKLLSNSEFFSIKKIPSPQTIGKYKGDLLELFIGIFIDELLGLFKRDINRNYNLNLENQSFIKGKIDFEETVKYNSYRRHLHYVRFDQFTENIIINRIFKTVILNLIKRSSVKENKMKLKQSLLWLEDVEAVNLNNEIWKSVKFSHLNNQYKPVFNLAKLFYYNSSPNLNKGDEMVFSFLVPINQLFERYVYEAINCNAGYYKVNYQGPVRYLAKQDGNNKLQLIPDITITENEDVKYIIDTKYKEIDILNNINVSQSDIYQMLAYSIRYECNKIALVYPKFLGDINSKDIESETLIDTNYGQVIIKIIKVDLVTDKKELGKMLNKAFGIQEI
jgi:5-methylcytosine-specific restriction enzyme subunit McrC